MVFDSLESPPSELPSLADEIYLDALDTIVPADIPPNVTVPFSYGGLRVFVHSSGLVCARSISDEDWPVDVDAAEQP